MKIKIKTKIKNLAPMHNLQVCGDALKPIVHNVHASYSWREEKLLKNNNKKTYT